MLCLNQHAVGWPRCRLRKHRAWASRDLVHCPTKINCAGLEHVLTLQSLSWRFYRADLSFVVSSSTTALKNAPSFSRLFGRVRTALRQATGLTSRGMLLLGTCVVGVFKLLGEIIAAILIER